MINKYSINIVTKDNTEVYAGCVRGDKYIVEPITESYKYIAIQLDRLNVYSISCLDAKLVKDDAIDGKYDLIIHI